MRISLNWLKKYIELHESVEELQNLLTFAGIEVEAVINMPALPDTIISAKVIVAKPVPKTDHLQSCLIDIGAYPYPEKTEEGYLQLICGAPNCRAGMMALIALPGSQLPEFTIGKAKIRGIESHGMLCSEKELGISDNHAGIIELPMETPIGITAGELFELPDTVFELEITPNRPDLLGYIGIARDLSAKLNRPLNMPEVTLSECMCKTSELPLELDNQAIDLCPRYIARLLKGVQIGPSPLWLKSALIKSGLRPINNLVDITNYVMLEFGHPLHAFDYNKLAPKPNANVPAIVVRKAAPQEAFSALDGKNYSLDEDDLVIADGTKPSALAGVMGGELSGISETTVNVVLESAAFAPGSIRRTSYKHKLSSDSSYRFERHLSDHSAGLPSLRAAQLICELAKAELCETAPESWPAPTKPHILGIRPSRYEQVIGYKLDGDKITDYLEKLGLKFIQYGSWKPGIIENISQVYCHHGEEIKQGKTEFSELPDCVHTLYFEVPTFRMDLEREIDLIEELARLDGYDKVPEKTKPQMVMDRHAYRVKRVAADYIVSRGFYETLNYSFSEPALMQKLGYGESDAAMQMIRLKNPQSSNQSAMRTSLVPHLLQNLLYNLNHGERNIKLFELGNTYHRSGKLSHEPCHLAAILMGTDRDEHWQNKASSISPAYVQGIVEELFALVNLNDYQCNTVCEPFLSPNDSVAYYQNDVLIGYFGKLKAPIAEAFGIDTIELKQDVWILSLELDTIVESTRNRQLVFSGLSRYPAVTRDISFLISNNVAYRDIETCLKGINTGLVSAINVFDEYRGKQIPDGYRSLSLHIKIQDKEKTLTEEVVDHLVASMIKKLQETWQITMR